MLAPARCPSLAVAAALAILVAGTHARAERPRADVLVERGDCHFVKGDRGRARPSTWTAIGFYKQALKADPRHFGALWRLARAFMWLGEQTSEKSEYRRLGWIGYGYAQRAIEVDQRRVEGHFWAALCIGEYGKGLGVISAIRQGIEKRFRGYLDASMRIDRSYDEGGPDRIYALYWHSLPWPLKDNKKAIYHFRRSLGYSQRNPFTHFYYAQVLADEDREQEARRHLTRCIGASTRQGDRFMARRCRSRLQKLED